MGWPEVADSALLVVLILGGLWIMRKRL